MAIGIAVYRKEDYQEILKISDDRATMDPTWKEWKDSKAKAVKNFSEIGMEPLDILVIPKELFDYCRNRGLPINGEERAEFVTYKLNKLDC